MAQDYGYNKIGFDVLLNYATIGIIVTDEQGRIILANPFLLNQFGYQREELLGEKVEVLIPARFSDRHVQHRNRFHEHPHSRPMGVGLELSARRKDGSEFPVEVSLGTYKTVEGQFVIAFVNDISYRKESENALKQLNAELEQKVRERTQSLTETVEKLGIQIREVEAKDAELQRMNSFLNSIWNYAEAIIIATDERGIIKMFNPTAERLLGYSAEEVIDRHTPVLFHDRAEVATRAALFSEQLGQEVPPGFDTFTVKARCNQPNEYEWQYICRDGRRFPVLLSVSALRDADGAITGFLGIATNISERKKAENELRVALEKEKELNELKSRFVSLASHEFRTPLSAIQSSAFLISKYAKTEEQPQREKHIQRISSSVNMLTDILNDFLSVGKIEEGKVQVRYTTFDVQKHVSNIIAEMQGLQKKRQSVTYSHSGNPEIELDAVLLKHIIMNLLSNAIKFSPEDATIEIYTKKEDSRFTLTVRDKGVGISQEDQQHLFERFFRGANVSNIQGTGLGLHIVGKYAELMNGVVTCKSELGRGSDFTVTFGNHFINA